MKLVTDKLIQWITFLEHSFHCISWLTLLRVSVVMTSSGRSYNITVGRTSGFTSICACGNASSVFVCLLTDSSLYGVISHKSWIFIKSAASTSATAIKHQYVCLHICVVLTVHVHNGLDGTGEREFGYPNCVRDVDVHPRRKWKFVSAYPS
jgi:hypothetical protein